MKVYLNEINGLWNAIDAMYFSKRTWTREKELEIKKLYSADYDYWGLRKYEDPIGKDLMKLMDTVFRWSKKHITLARFIDFSFTIEGLHRGAQDDFDSHARRLENRIIRSSTRLGKFGYEKSDWYKGKIISTDEMFALQGVDLPETQVIDGVTWVKCVNGYVREDLQHDQDVVRGLYMLSIPSNFTFKVNATEFAHIVKERDQFSHAHPELREMITKCEIAIEKEIPQCNSDYWHELKN